MIAASGRAVVDDALALARRQARRLRVVITGRDQIGNPTRTVVSHHATEHSAFGRVCEILGQWGDSHGAVPVNTTVSIVDTNDGGTVFAATYLGYEPDLLSGR